MKKHILVTGGAGFIGSNIIKYHLDKGDDVWAVDNLSTGKIENLPQASGSLRFDQADLRNWIAINEAIDWADYIYHMAASVGQKLVLGNPVDTLSNNIQGCEVILKAMAKKKSKARLLIASTSSVYCHSEQASDGKVSEDSILCFPTGQFLQENYGASKLINELMALSYHHQYDLDCVIVRLFNTIGVNQSPFYGMVVPTFIKQALAGKPITIYGDGLQSRSFSNVFDNVRAMDLLLENPKSKGEIVNVGDDRECSILNLAHMVKNGCSSSSDITFISYQDAYGINFMDVRRRRPNLEKLISLTGFSPRWSLEDTLKQVIDSFKNQ